MMDFVMLSKRSACFIIFLCSFLSSCQQEYIGSNIPSDRFDPINWEAMLLNNDVPVYGYKIIQKYPHDTSSYTEGLILGDDGSLYESSGLYTVSTLKHFNLQRGTVFQEISLPPQYFGEGITLLNNRIYQLTYQENIGFIYDKNTFKQLGSFHIPSQGWGLTNDGRYLIMSNGSSALLYLDPNTLTIHHMIIVKHREQPIGALNSLEYANGKIYANIYRSNVIAIISPNDGHIEGWINLEGLSPLSKNEVASGSVLNGIAYSKKDDAFIVTGKNWPFMAMIKLVPKRHLQ